MNKQRILVVEDDAAIRRGILQTLRMNGYEVSEARDGQEGLVLALQGDYDLLLLDLVLPEVAGLEILRQVRARDAAAPIIILTAMGEEGDRVQGLKLGADDYVVKPFGVPELVARIEAVLRRSPARPSEPMSIEIPGGVLDLGRRELHFADGTTTPLSERETELLTYLVRNPGRAIPREELLARVWKLNPDAVETRTIDMHIAHLREKLRDSAGSARVIRTLRGRGYAFHPEG